MAATDAKPIPRKGIAHRVYFPILDADGDPVADGAGLLGLVSTDAAAFATVASAPTQVSVSSGVYFCDLSTTEMNGDAVVLKVTSTTSGAKATIIVLYPQEAGDIRVNVTYVDNAPIVSTSAAGVLKVDTTHWGGTAVGSAAVRSNIIQVDNAPITSPGVTGALNVNVTHAAGTAWASGAITAASIATGAVDADAVAADAVTEIQSGLATAASLNSVNADVVAIKTKTDQLNFTSGAVYSDIVRVDHAPITSPGVTGALNVNVTHAAATAWASGAITAASIATGAVDADAIAADAVTEIQNGLATAAAVDAVDNFVDTEITALQASVNSVNADVVAIKTKTDQLNFTSGSVYSDLIRIDHAPVTSPAVAGVLNVNMSHISGTSSPADRLERSTSAIVLGTVGTSSTTTAVKFSSLDPASGVNDQFKGRIITFDKDTTTAALRGQATDITAFDHATQIATVTALTTAPASGDTCTIT